MKNIQFGVVCMALCSALAVLPLEAVVLRSPADGEAVCLTTPGRQAFLRMSHGERRAAFTNLTWRKWAAKEIRSKPAPVVLRWEGVVPADGFRVSVVRTGQATPWFDERVTNCEATVWNLEIARDYAWTVSDGREEKTGHFRTQDLAPRDIHVEGIPNIRDLGGRVGLNGRRVRQGLVYRSGGLNDNADVYLSPGETMRLYKEGRLEELYGKQGKKVHDQIARAKGKFEFDPKAPFLRKAIKRHDPRPPKARLDESGRRYMTDKLGIKTDLDIRSDLECWSMTGSPLGPGVKWIHIPYRAYAGMGAANGKASFKRAFAVFLDEKNYPIDFHCIGGADRTGSLAYVLEGLLGMDDESIEKDWEITCFEYESQGFGHKARYDQLLKVFAKYPGATTRERCEAYVREQGFSDGDIGKLREIILED